jgi:hypothetical protein
LGFPQFAIVQCASEKRPSERSDERGGQQAASATTDPDVTRNGRMVLAPAGSPGASPASRIAASSFLMGRSAHWSAVRRSKLPAFISSTKLTSHTLFRYAGRPEPVRTRPGLLIVQAGDEARRRALSSYSRWK